MRFARHPLALFVVLAVAKHVAIGAQLGGGLHGLRFVLATLGMVLLGIAFAGRAEGHAQRWRLIAFDALTTLLAWADLLHFRAFGDVPTVASLRSAAQLADVAGAVVDLVRPWDVVVLATVPAFLLPSRTPRMRGWSVVAVCALAAILLVSTAASSRMARRRYRGNAWYAAAIGLAPYHAIDLAAYVQKERSRLVGRDAAAREVGAALAARGQLAPSDLEGAAAGRNVLVVQLESFQATAVGRRVGGQPVTPNLDALAAESLRFSAYFEQAAGGRTSDAQFVSNCSLFGARTGAAVFEYESNEFQCLPSLLRGAGYHTALFQPLGADFWNSSTFDPRLGFSQVVSARDLVVDESFGLGLSDRSFFRQILPRIERLPEPWYAFALSVTSHQPYADPRMPRTLDVGDLAGTRAGNYLQAVHYTDAAIGELVAGLRERGLLERTVLVLYGDHDGVTRRTGNLADLVDHGDDELAWFREEQRIPLLIRLPGGAHAGEVDHIGGQIDLAPTLLGLLGSPAHPAAFLGRDLLAPGRDPSVAFVDGSVFAGDRLLLAGEGRCFEPGHAVPMGACAPLDERWRGVLELNQRILDKNLVPLLVRSAEAMAAAAH